tara:strand:+ start:82 stop:624 length:543 start_codon:yes stop_codon:yes gene_type:complete
MEKFKISKENNYSQLPIKDRIKSIQDQGIKLSGKKITWKQAKETYHYIMAGTTYINNTYQVQHCVGNEVKDLYDENLRNKLDYLSIKRRDKKPCRNWSDFQEIKNMLCKNGENRFAVEVYPPEKFLINTSNQYHLWVFDEKIELGFGFRQRFVNTKNGYSTHTVNGIEFTTGQGDINNDK